MYIGGGGVGHPPQYSHFVNMPPNKCWTLPTTQSWRWKESGLCQALPGLKRPAWLQVVGVCSSPLCHNRGAPLWKRYFWLRAVLGCRFSQTAFYCHCTKVHESNVSYSRLSLVWRLPMFLDSVWLPPFSEIALPKIYNNLSLKTFHISYNYRPVLIR